MRADRFSLDEVSFFGRGLNRPECVLCRRDGSVHVPDWEGGVTCIGPDGKAESVHSGVPEADVRPNSIALCRDGNFLLASLGEDGGVWRLKPGGTAEPFLCTVDGVDLPPTNFVLVDHFDRVWITVSTRRVPRALGYRPDVADGFVVLMDERGARIVADGLGYTNEVRLNADGTRLYVVETFGRRISRFAVRPDSSLSEKETFATFGPGTFPDGIAFDAEGHLWVASIVSNRLIRVAPDGTQSVLLEDSDPAHVDWVERAFQAASMERRHMDAIVSKTLQSISSLAFGGPDLRTLYLGCLHGDRLARLRSPVAGVPMAHWNWT